MRRETSIVPEDILKLSVPGSLHTSADGELLVFHLKKAADEQRYESRIMVWTRADGKLKAVGTGTGPRLSPDGSRIAWIERDNLIVYEIASETSRNCGTFLRCRDLAWSADSGKICFTYADRLPRLPGDLPPLQSVVWVDRLKFKSDGEGLCDGSYRHAACIDLETAAVTTLCSERCDFACPTFIGSEKIAASCVRVNGDNSDHASLMLFDLASGSLTEYPGPGGPITRLAASHCGNQIAALTHDNSQWEATNFKIYTWDLSTGEYRCRTAGFDRSVGNYASSKAGFSLDGYHFEWSQDDSAVYTLVTNKSVCGIYRLELASGAMEKLCEPRGIIYDYAVFDRGFYYLLSEDDKFGRIYRREADGSSRVVWREDSLDARAVSAFQGFTFAGFDGSEREGFYMPPLGEMKGVVLDIHGGPHYSYGLSFSLDAQMYAANGYGVVFCNPAGSQGYGQAVAKASKHDWGGKDFREIMRCVETACARFGLGKYPWAVVGGSYGGYMVNWVIGHTNFFRCAVSERGSCNRYSQSGTSDCAYRYGEFEFTGYAWDSPDHYREHSPITYVRDIQTPLLLIHGEQDMNCSISQSEEMYSACKLMGKDVYFARFPGQSHGFATQGTPASRMDRYRLLLWWMERYLTK